MIAAAHVLRAPHGREPHESGAVGELGLDRARGLERQPCLADAARPRQSQQPHRPGPHAVHDRAISRARPIVRFGGAAARAPALGGRCHRQVRPARWGCRGRRRAARLHQRRPVKRRVLDQDRRVHNCSSEPGSMPAPRPRSRGRAGSSPARRPGGRCDTARASAALQPLAVGCAAREPLKLAHQLRGTGRARSASTRNSSATSAALRAARSPPPRTAPNRTPPAAAPPQRQRLT